MVTVNVNTILQKYGWFVFVSTILTIFVTFSLNLCLISSPNFPFDFEVGSKKKRRKNLFLTQHIFLLINIL